MTTIAALMKAILLGSTLLIALCSSDERLLDADDFVCPYEEEKLYYNIAIFIEGIGQGCESYDLYNIGELLQRVVDEVEEEIPEYERAERMETTICPFPEEENLKRHLRAKSTEAIANLNGVQQGNRPRELARNRYKYRGSGKCIRCRAQNSDRHLQALSVDDACEKADKATYATLMAMTATKNSQDIVKRLREHVLRNCDFTSSGQETTLTAKEWLQEGIEALGIAQKETRRSKKNCQLAKRAETDLERLPFIRPAMSASDDAVNAARNARNSYFRLRDDLNTNVCFQEPHTDNAAVITIRTVCHQADLAEFCADLAATAVIGAGDSFSELKERVMECKDLPSSQDLVTGAKGFVAKVKSAQRVARKSAQQARIQCQKASQASSGAQVKDYLQQAQEMVGKVLDATEKADSDFLRLMDVAGQRDVCSSANRAPRTDISVETVCERVNVAIYGAELAGTAFKNTNAAFNELREQAVECLDLTSGQVSVTRGKELLAQSKTAKTLAQKLSKEAAEQCRKAKAKTNPSSSKLREHLQLASEAASGSMDVAQNAKNLYVQLRDSINDICFQKQRIVTNDEISAESVCRHADVASFGAEIVAAGLAKGNEAFFSIREQAMECNDWYLGNEVATNAQRTLAETQRGRRLVSNGARRARKECQRAKQATTSDQVKQSLSKVKTFANDSMKAARQAQASYFDVRNSLDFSSSICGGADSPDIGASFEASNSSYYMEGTDSTIPLRVWVIKLANMLYEKIPSELIEKYGRSPTPQSCQFEGFKVEISIDVFEEISQRDNYIKGKGDCVII